MSYLSTDFGEYAIQGGAAGLAASLQRDLATARERGRHDRVEVLRYMLSKVLDEHGRRIAMPIRREEVGA